MPILRLNSKGEVYDPNMGTHNAPLVEESNVYQLSEKTPGHIVAAQAKAGALARKQSIEAYKAKVIGTAIAQAKKDAQDWARAKKEEMLRMKQMQWDNSQSKIMMAAVKTARKTVPKYDGVTGDPLEGGFEKELKLGPDFATYDRVNRGGGEILHDQPDIDFAYMKKGHPFGGRR